MDAIDQAAYMAAEKYADAVKSLGRSPEDYSREVAEVFVKTKKYIVTPPQPEPPVTPSQQEESPPSE